MYSALIEIIDNPGAVALFLIVSAVLFFVSRLVIDSINSGWSRRVVKELDVLERMKKAELDSNSKGKIAISSIESHISRMVINNTTRRDRLGTIFEALQFFIIGSISIMIVLAWGLFWGDIQPRGKEDVLSIIALCVVFLLLCLLVDVARLFFLKWLTPKLKLLLHKFRIGWTQLVIYKRVLSIKKEQKRATDTWKSISEMTNMIVDSETQGMRPAKAIEFSNRARGHLAKTREYKNMVESAIDQIDDVCSYIGRLASNLQGRLESRVWSIIITQLNEIRGTYLVQLRYAEQHEETLKKVAAKYPGSKKLLPTSV